MKGRRPKAEMAVLKEKALGLSEVNPTLSMAAIARHVGVTEATMQRWFTQARRVRWFC